MNKLSKQQKDEFATAFAILALYDGGAAVTADQINALLQATGNTEVEAFYPIIFANFVGNPEKLGALIAFPGSGGGAGAGGGGGGGGGGVEAGAAAAAPEEEKEEEKEEEMDLGGGMDMFGGGDEDGGGGGGDY